METLQGAPNFRDLGGSLTAAGQVVRRGRVFRSQRLAGLSQSDLIWLERSGIAGGLDLRPPADPSKSPNEWSGDRALRTIVLDLASGGEAATPQYWRRRLADPA